MIYADNSATTKLSPRAFDAMKNFFINDYDNPSEPYSFSREAKVAIERGRETVVSCLKCDPMELYWTSGGTEGDNWAIKSIIGMPKGYALAISAVEHHAVSLSGKFTESLGYPLYIISCNKGGTVTKCDLEKTFCKAKKNGDKIGLVSVMTANNEIGTIEPIKELCEVAHSNGILFHTDAVAAVGHIALDVRDLGVDILSASSHKFFGPKGAGFLYIKNGVNIQNLLHGGGQERFHRVGTENTASIVGTAVALKDAVDNLPNAKKFLSQLECDLLKVLKEKNIDFIRNGENQLPGHISLSIRGCDGEALLHYLDLKGVCVSTGSACNAGALATSDVLRATKTPAPYIKGTVRVTFSFNNNAGDGCEVASLIAQYPAITHK